MGEKHFHLNVPCSLTLSAKGWGSAEGPIELHCALIRAHVLNTMNMVQVFW